MLWVYNYKFQIKLIFCLLSDACNYFNGIFEDISRIHFNHNYDGIDWAYYPFTAVKGINIFCSYIKSIHFFSTKLIYIFLPDLISVHNESYNFILAGGCVSCRSSGKYNVYKLPPPPPLKMIDMQLTGKQGKKNKPVIWSFNNLTYISQLNNLFHLFLFPNILQNHFPRNISLRK